MDEASILIKNIRSRMQHIPLTIRDIEREAGFKRGRLSNILDGNSKKPSAETLKGIATVLGCSLSDLIDPKEETDSSKYQKQPTSTFSPPLIMPVFLETIEVVAKKFEKHNSEFNLEEILDCVRKVYTYALGDQPQKPNSTFAEWLIEQYNK